MHAIPDERYQRIDSTSDRSPRPALPTARVNLLPAEIAAAREVRKIQRRIVAGLAAVVVAAVGGYGYYWFDASKAASSLADEQQTLATMRVQQQKYSELPQIQVTTQNIDSTLEAVMVNDVAWDRYLDALSASVPAGVVLTTLTVSLDDVVPNSAGGGPADVTTGSLDTSGQPHIGMLTVSGHAPDHDTVAGWATTLKGIDGFLVPYVLGSREVVGGLGQIEFTIQVTVGADVRTHRYDPTPDELPAAPAGSTDSTDQEGS
jgi:Tfp pilus assembly protein PilN